MGTQVKLNNNQASLAVQSPVELLEQGKNAAIIRGSDGSTYAVLSTGTGTTKQTEIFKIDLSQTKIDLTTLVGTKYTQPAGQTAAEKNTITGVSNATVREELQRLIALERQTNPPANQPNPTVPPTQPSPQPSPSPNPQPTLSPNPQPTPSPNPAQPPQQNQRPLPDVITADGKLSDQEKKAFVAWMKDPALKEFIRTRFQGQGTINENNGIITVTTKDKAVISLDTNTGDIKLSHPVAGDLSNNAEYMKLIEAQFKGLIEEYQKAHPI